MTSSSYEKPLPRPDTDTAGFWEGTRRHELRMKRCGECARYRFPPGPACPYCGSWQASWKQVSGRGRINSFVVVHQAFARPFSADLPYAVVEVELEEQDGVLLYGNVVGCSNEELQVGLLVEAVFVDVTEDTTLVQWTPLQARGD